VTKIALLAFGGIALAAGLLGWDAQARAARALRAHEERLAADIAALRSKPTLLETASLPEPPKALPLPSLLLEGRTRRMTYEIAHAGQEGLIRDYVRTADILNREGWMEATPAELLRKLALSQESLREGGYLAYECRRLDEERGLRLLLEFLEKRNPGADELRQVAGMLDLLLWARPTAREVLLAESVLDRQQVLIWRLNPDDNYWMLVDAPGWKEAFSKSFLAVKALNQLRDLEQLMLEIEALPMLEREPRAIEEGQKNLRSARLARSELAARAGALFQGERLLRTQWALARAATAIRRFQAEKKRNPAQLQELVPDFLAELPINVYTQEPFLWDKDQGVIKTRPGGPGPQSHWALGRP
jgi:hypothetical protein